MTKKQIAIMVVFAMLLSLVVFFATVMTTTWYVKQDPAPDMLSMVTEVFLPKSNASEQAHYYPLDKLVLNVKGNRKSHYVMLEMAIKTYQPDSIEQIDQYQPLIFNTMLQFFSNKNYQELQQQPLLALQQEVTATLKQAFVNTPIVADIDDVLFTKYVIQ